MILKFIKKLLNNGWEEVEHTPKWINYDKLNRGNPDNPGVKFIKYFKGKTFSYKYVSYRGFENQGHGSDCCEKLYRKKRTKF